MLQLGSSLWKSQHENLGVSLAGVSPVSHQHLDDKVGEKDQEGAGCIVLEGRECREPVLEKRYNAGVEGPLLVCSSP